MGYLLLDDSIIKNKQVYYPKQDYDLLSEKFKIDFNIKKNKWKKAAEKELTMYEYLKKNIYKD
jgi:hypothetical protein